MAYKPVRVETADAATLNRMQSNIAAEFAAIETPSTVGVTRVSSSRSLTSYTVGSSDRYVVVNASAGGLRVALPAPGNQQVVTVVKADTSKNAITVTPGGGKPFGAGQSAVMVDTATTFLCDGTAWWVL